MKKITLSNEELLTIQIFSNLRAIECRLNNVRDTKRDKRNGADIDFDGFVGEYAFCKLFNLFLELDPTPRSGSYDCKRRDGKRIDVKTTRHLVGQLIVTLKDNPDVDIYVLCLLKDNTAMFPGWIEKEKICQQANITDFGYGTAYAMNQIELNKF